MFFDRIYNFLMFYYFVILTTRSDKMLMFLLRNYTTFSVWFLVQDFFVREGAHKSKYFLKEYIIFGCFLFRYFNDTFLIKCSCFFWEITQNFGFGFYFITKMFLKQQDLFFSRIFRRKFLKSIVPLYKFSVKCYL
jgi:hypothetical protein